QAMVSAWGFPSPGPDEPAFGPAEADALIAAAAHREWWPADVQLEVSRVWGQALSRIAATEVYNFRFGLEPQVRRGERTPGEALAAIQQALAELLPLADPLLLGVHRRWIDYELTQYAVREAERHAPDATIPGAVEVCLLFCDLKDFTAYADVHGDRAATEAAARFARVTSDERGEHGQVVKGLGDGAMLVYPEAGEAVDAWRRFHDAMDEPGLPALHGAVHQGEVLRIEGDYFGGAVNLTARLLSLAGTGELLATGAAVARAGGHRWLPLGTRALRGLREEVAVFLLDDGA
ncbi:MAG: adenylate/guanylate cyclase domain-containing protein, partial [Solirubrobacterales bacterium]|nr:adenylate/guanylate cyclase domain-containing protein [Solirubrobacterales bacterium]